MITLLLSIIQSTILYYTAVGLLIQFPGFHGSATFWPNYYGPNRELDSVRVTSSNGFRSPLDQSTWLTPTSSSSASSYYSPPYSSYYQQSPQLSSPTPSTSSRYPLLPTSAASYNGNSYYGSSFPFAYYSYMSSLPYYSGSAYPYNEWWKFYSQYPTRNSYSNWPSTSYTNTAYNNQHHHHNNALAIHCRYASFYRPGHPTYPYYQHPSSTGSSHSSPSQYYPIYSYGSTSYPFTYEGFTKSPTINTYPYNYGNNYYYPPPSPPSSSSSSPNYYGLGSISPSLLSPPPHSPSSALPSSSRDLWNWNQPSGIGGYGGDVDFNRRMGWLGTIPSPTNPYASTSYQLPSASDPLYGNTFPQLSSHLTPAIKSARAVAEITGPSGVTGTIIFKQIGSRPVSIEGKIMGLTPGPHGMHIYEMPFLGGDCTSAGDHYNPQKTEHGGKHDWNRHIGDLGNIFADSHGVASFDLTDLLISLTGGYSIVNRTIAISEKADDLGRGSDGQSKRDGNSGPPIACGIIRLSII